MCTVCRTEGVVHIAVSIGSQHLGELLLAFLDGLLGSLLLFFRSIVGKTAGFAFLFCIEAEVLQQDSLARFQGSHDILSLLAVVSKFDIYAQHFRYMSQDVFQRILGIRVLLGASHVRSNDQHTAIGQDLFQGRHGCTDAGIVGDVEILVQGNVEVYTDKCLLSGKIEVVNGLHSVFDFLLYGF